MVVVRLDLGSIEWTVVGLCKLEVWMAVTRAAIMMAVVVKVVVVMVSKAMVMVECCLQGEDVWLIKFEARHGIGKKSTGTTLIGISGMGGKGVWAGDEGAGWA